MSIRNCPPPKLAITYTVICKGNDVYRVEGAALLSELPANDDNMPALISGGTHLIDALESVGEKKVGAWAAYFESLHDESARVVAWAL